MEIFIIGKMNINTGKSGTKISIQFKRNPALPENQESILDMMLKKEVNNH